MEIDVICLANTQDENLHAITSRTLKTLHDSEKNCIFKVHLVETNVNTPYLYKGLITNRILPKEPFNYNRFINLCYPYIVCDWILIINNDLRFERGWFSKILEIHKKRPDIDSYSPKCPILYSKYFHNHFLGTEQDYYESYQVTEFLVGWCFVMNKRVWNAVYPWDEQFDLYYQDNDYAERIKELGIKHALVRDSIVVHLGSQTLGSTPTQGFGHHELKFRQKWNIWD